jgi:adenylate kinase family enzyme
LDGSKLEVRPDDREEVVRQRLVQYDGQTQPLIDFFRDTSRRCYRVNASDAKPEEVFRRIQMKLQAKSKSDC